MDRKTWSVAWRHARRLTGRHRHLGEKLLLNVAQSELGGQRLPLTCQCTALGCLQARRYGPAVASFAQARTKRFYALADKCRDRWEREALAESPLLAAKVDA